MHRPTTPLIGFTKRGKPIYLIAGGSEGAPELETQPDQSQGQELPDTTPEPDVESPWSKYLEGVPTAFRPTIEGRFKEWDADVTRKFQQVHSEYEPYKAFQPLLDAGYDPQQLYQLADTINNDPRRLYDALVSNFGDEWGLNGQVQTPEQGQHGTNVDEDLLESDPRYAELKSTVDIMADIFLEQHRREQEQTEDQQLDQYLGALKQQFGEYDEKVVLGLMNAGLSGEDAVKAYQNSITQALQQRNRPQAPRILGSGGGIPTESVDLSKSQNRKNLVTQMLTAAKEQT